MAGGGPESEARRVSCRPGADGAPVVREVEEGALRVRLVVEVG